LRLLTVRLLVDFREVFRATRALAVRFVDFRLTFRTLRLVTRFFVALRTVRLTDFRAVLRPFRATRFFVALRTVLRLALRALRVDLARFRVLFRFATRLFAFLTIVLCSSLAV